MEIGIVVLLVLVVIYTIMGHTLARVWITMPMFFVIAGAIAGPHGLGWITFGLETTDVETLTELTLAFLLFADAATLDFNQVKEDTKIPGRLLFVAFPLVVLMGALIGYLLFPDEKIGFALLIGAILAPTDAALGLPIFNNPRVPVRIRRALNVESGLNDGLATPLVTLFIAMTLEELGSGQQGQWLFSAVSEIVIAIVVGIALGLLGGWLFALGLVWVFVMLEVFTAPFGAYIIPITIIAIIGTLIESLPIQDLDNITVTLIAVILGHWLL